MPRPLRSDTARAIANLAIEVGDPGRMAKARRLHRKGGVASVEVAARSASTSVSDADDAWSVELRLGPSTIPGQIPTPDDLTTTCDCGEGGDASCRHILAALLGLAEAFEVNARLLDEWTDAPREVSLRERPSDRANSFFGEPGTRRTITSLTPRTVEFPPLLVDATDAGPVFEDAIKTIRRALTPYRARQ